MDIGAPLLFDTIPVPTPPDGPLAIELVPAPDAWTVARKLAHLPHLLFLDSAEKHTERGRYSYVMAAPAEWISTSVTRQHHLFQNLREKYKTRAGSAGNVENDLPPFRGGYAGLFGYGLCHAFERLPPSQFDEFRVPDLAVGRYECVVAFDHITNRAWLLGHPHRRKTLDTIRACLARPIPEQVPGPSRRARPVQPLAPQHPLPGYPGVTSNFSREGYEAAVRRAIEYIHAGDCFQVNLSQRLLAPLREHPLELYGRLRTLNPAPFGVYFDLGDFQILSASPERFLRVHPCGTVETRPIKGTRPRGRTPTEDATLIRDLANSHKDRAENVMIVDLLRNDIGKACVFGSVTVTKICEVETFRYVHHLVSEIRGKLRGGLGPLDLLAGAFPGGSVTGAPKVRAMQIITELEPTARGPYCGCLGWMGFDGAMDTNILIRTFTAGRGWLQFPVGGGVVADSDPIREYEETLHKAAGLLSALKPL